MTRYDHLTSILIDKLHGRCLWSVPGPPMHGSKVIKPSRLEGWTINGRPGVLVVHVYPDDSGVAIYVDDNVPDGWTELEAFLRRWT